VDCGTGRRKQAKAVTSQVSKYTRGDRTMLQIGRVLETFPPISRLPLSRTPQRTVKRSSVDILAGPARPALIVAVAPAGS
jgi:hypothetical protein